MNQVSTRGTNTLNLIHNSLVVHKFNTARKNNLFLKIAQRKQTLIDF